MPDVFASVLLAFAASFTPGPGNVMMAPGGLGLTGPLAAFPALRAGLPTLSVLAP